LTWIVTTLLFDGEVDVDVGFAVAVAVDSVARIPPCAMRAFGFSFLRSYPSPYFSE
jgi:hypothetical protein